MVAMCGIHFACFAQSMIPPNTVAHCHAGMSTISCSDRPPPRSPSNPQADRIPSGARSAMHQCVRSLFRLFRLWYPVSRPVHRLCQLWRCCSCPRCRVFQSRYGLVRPRCQLFRPRSPRCRLFRRPAVPVPVLRWALLEEPALAADPSVMSVATAAHALLMAVPLPPRPVALPARGLLRPPLSGRTLPSGAIHRAHIVWRSGAYGISLVSLTSEQHSMTCRGISGQPA